MAPPQPEPLKLFTRDIAAYSDAELDEYLEANGRLGFLKLIISVANVHV